MEVDWTPASPPASKGRDMKREGPMTRSPPVPPRGPDSASTPHKATTGSYMTSSKPAGPMSPANGTPNRTGHNMEPAPPIPRKPMNLHAGEGPKSTPSGTADGRANAGPVPIPKGTVGGQTSAIQGGANRPPQGAGSWPVSQNRDLQSPGARSAGQEGTENKTGDLLGGGTGEEVSWKPLLQ